MKTVVEKGIANPGRGKTLGKAIVMSGTKPKKQTYPTMNMAQGLPKDGYNRTTTRLKADRAMKKLERAKKVKHSPLI
jgi:hypothetical protein